MLPLLLSAAALACLSGCRAVGNSRLTPEIRYARSVGVRQYMESIIESSNATTSQASILDVYLSQDKESYYTVITLGNMNFRVALDTGSSDLWLVSSACTSSACSSVPRYQLAYESSTFVPVNDNSTAFNVSYLDTTSFIARETVFLGNLSVPEQAFGLMNSSNVTLNDEISGVLGLGFPRLSTISNTIANATPIFGTTSEQGTLDYPLFGLHLNPNGTGSVTFGAIDATVVANRSLIEWNEVVPFAPFNGTNGTTASYLQWAVELSLISVNGTEIIPLPTYPQSASNHSLALIDAGTSGIYGPYQDVSRIFDKIAGSRLVDTATGQWAMPCDSNETISLSIGESNYTLQPTDYLIGPTSTDPYYCLAWPAALPPSSDGIDWQLGTPFMQTVYSIFSFGIDTKEAPMIGFYPLRNSSVLVQSPATVSSYFSAASATVNTALPNYLLPTPTYTTPAYVFNTSIAAPLGLIVSSGLATSTYSPLLGTQSVNNSALPTVEPTPTLYTFFITYSGSVSTSVSTVPQPSITLGEPPGWTSGASGLRIPLRIAMFSLLFALLGFTV
ncbi:uncharacterized protein FIBRA_02120 [Fibroporia radiculosa]|uniref:Peptidase A1 domain-containing protein n=1 Tax=Fibroporia radiculosa TaxID=599839 RepID=J4G1D1_9APHY|nr:uncharacterized protein FIBRA_02120 [Fibroporia radiculosa]CCM00093.1 predicted protein [Fibroporia radiculosa]